MSRPPVWPVHGAGRGTGGIDRVDRDQGARRPFELHLRAGLGGLGLVVLLAGCPAWTSAGALAESWAGLMTYPREAPAPREEASLLSAWGEMLANYPAAAMRSGARTLEALEGIPAAYRRQHRHYDSGPKEWARRLAPYRHWVDTAARRFDVSPSLIEGVILQESGGDAAARATGSSAKGLMQTIDATFALAKKTLAGEGLRIEDPLTPPRLHTRRRVVPGLLLRPCGSGARGRCRPRGAPRLAARAGVLLRRAGLGSRPARHYSHLPQRQAHADPQEALFRRGARLRARARRGHAARGLLNLVVPGCLEGVSRPVLSSRPTATVRGARPMPQSVISPAPRYTQADAVALCTGRWWRPKWRSSNAGLGRDAPPPCHWN